MIRFKFSPPYSLYLLISIFNSSLLSFPVSTLNSLNLSYYSYWLTLDVQGTSSMVYWYSSKCKSKHFKKANLYLWLRFYLYEWMRRRNIQNFYGVTSSQTWERAASSAGEHRTKQIFFLLQFNMSFLQSIKRGFLMQQVKMDLL